MLIPALTFLLVLLIVLGAYWAAVVRPEQATRHTVRRRLRAVPAVQATGAALLREAIRLSNVPAFNRMLLQRASLVGPIRRLVEQSGLTVNVGTVVLASGCAFLATFILVVNVWHQLVLGLALAVVAGAVPLLVVKRARDKRIGRFEELFPEALDLIVRAMRAGHAFTTGLGMVAEELPEPLAAEFKLLYDRQNFGMPVTEALRDFAARIPLIDAKFFVTAVLTQREAGGNLSEVLENLAAVMRDRFEVRRQVRSKTAHGRMTGWVLIGLPPALAVGFMVVSPEHMRMLVTDPIGVRMIAAAVALEIIGALIIRRIVDVEY